MAIDVNNIGGEAEAKIVAFFNKQKQSRMVAWGAVVAQFILSIMLAVANVNSMIAAAVCFVTACILIWLLASSRPVLATTPGA